MKRGKKQREANRRGGGMKKTHASKNANHPERNVGSRFNGKKRRRGGGHEFIISVAVHPSMIPRLSFASYKSKSGALSTEYGLVVRGDDHVRGRLPQGRRERERERETRSSYDTKPPLPTSSTLAAGYPGRNCDTRARESTRKNERNRLRRNYLDHTRR